MAFLANRPVFNVDALGLKCFSKCGADVTDAVLYTLDVIEQTWSDAPGWQKFSACSALYNLTTRPGSDLPIAAGAWAIIPLANTGSCPDDQPLCIWGFRGYGYALGGDSSGILGGCSGTVGFSGACYQARDVHYLMWGRVNRLCNRIRPLEFNLTTALYAVRVWKTVFHEDEHEYVAGAVAFTEAGYVGMQVNNFIQSEWQCEMDSNNRVPKVPLPWIWEGLHK